MVVAFRGEKARHMIQLQNPKRRTLLLPTMEGPILSAPENSAEIPTTEEMPSLPASPPTVPGGRLICKQKRGAVPNDAPQESVSGYLMSRESYFLYHWRHNDTNRLRSLTAANPSGIANTKSVSDRCDATEVKGSRYCHILGGGVLSTGIHSA